MSYTREDVEGILVILNEADDALNDAIAAAEEYMETLTDDEADEDELGLSEQNLQDTLDAVEGLGVQLKARKD